MKRRILFVQGGGRGAHDEWDKNLVESLQRELGPSYQVRYPRMPNEEQPRYVAWKTMLESELGALEDGAILVGHSVGATILVGMLAERATPRKLGAVLLIAAPFVGEGGWPGDELEFGSDLGARLPERVRVHFFHGLDDEVAPLSHVELYARAVPQARIHRLRGRDHQLDNNLTEVASVILSLEGKP